MSVAPAAPARPRRHSVVHRLRVREVERLTDDSVAVTFAVPPELAAEYDFAAGQHVNVALPAELAPPQDDGARRSYSICTPAGSGVLRIGVKRLPDGVFSQHCLDVLAPGDELDVMTPAGRFTPTIDPASARHHAAIAAGSGITPILSIVATVLRAEPRSRFTVVYGNRSTATTMFLDELAELKDRWPDRLHVVHVFSREPRAVRVLSGRLDRERLVALFETIVPAATVDEWYLCGPYELVRGTRALLAERAVPSAHVHTELFHVGDVPPPALRERPEAARGCEVSASLDGRRSVVRLDDPDETVLEAVLRVRNDAPFACRGGVCGTCRAKLLTGEVTMERRYALEDDEIAAGYVLTCQSHPTTAELAVDYDA